MGDEVEFDCFGEHLGPTLNLSTDYCRMIMLRALKQNVRHSPKEGNDCNHRRPDTATGEMIKIGYQAQLKFNGRFPLFLPAAANARCRRLFPHSDNCLLRMQAQFYSPSLCRRCINKMMNWESKKDSIRFFLFQPGKNRMRAEWKRE